MVQFAYYDDQWKQHVPDHKGLSAEDEYQALTAEIVKLTSHDVVADAEGNLIPREDREANYRRGVRFLNDRLKLGLDSTEVEMLTLVYTALSEVKRFGGNDHIDPIKAGNTATHSIHTPLRANLLIRRALEEVGEDESRESVVLRQLAGLCLMPHDLGESLGEPGSLAQESKIANFQKDKPAAEELVMNSILRVAAHAVERGDYSLFYDRLDAMKIPDIGEQAPAQTNEEFLDNVKSKLGVPPQITVENEGRVAILSDFWNMQERPDRLPPRFQGDESLNPEFIRQLAALCEHVQGQGHFIAMTPHGGEPEGDVMPWNRVRSIQAMKNLKYSEGEIGNLFANAHTPLEKAIAVEAKKESYEKSLWFIENGTDAIDRDGTITSELSPRDSGRLDEIAGLLARSEAEGVAALAEGRDHEVRTVETRERLAAMYRWAIEHDDFIPEPGQVLVYNPPAEFRFGEEAKDKGFAGKLAAERAQPQAMRSVA